MRDMAEPVTATWLTAVLHDAGIRVVEHDGWKTRSHGEFTDLRSVVWHHDASAVGYSPGMPQYMIDHWNTASANCWVTLDGSWHLIGAGVAYHAGTVLPGKPGNHSSIGVETDHTTGETWSGVQLLDSLRKGTAAILTHLGQPAGALEFHKTICSPPGRKTDPDALDLATERRAVAALQQPTSQPGDDVHEYKIVAIPPVNDKGTQLQGHDISGAELGVFRQDVTVTIKANDSGAPVKAIVQPYAYNGKLALSFIGLDGNPAPPGNVGVVLSHPPR